MGQAAVIPSESEGSAVPAPKNSRFLAALGMTKVGLGMTKVGLVAAERLIFAGNF